jgi:hypothetical protein
VHSDDPDPSGGPVTAIATQPDAAIAHGEVESELRGIPVRRIVSLWGHRVHRLDLWHFSIDGAPPERLLPAIDRLMRRHRHLAFSPSTGQDSPSDRNRPQPSASGDR